MAKPKVFISSTFFDLQGVRTALEQFCLDVGFEPVLFERGDVPYSSDARPEVGAYREIEQCDILVSIIGSRSGSQSTDDAYSISQKELKLAHEKGKQIYIFIQTDVFHEIASWRKNREIVDYEPAHADRRVFQFIEEVYRFTRNNPIAPFTTHAEIISFLRNQWAGLFHRYLTLARQEDEREAIDNLKVVSRTLQSLVNSLSDQIESKQLVRDVLLLSHPAFAALAKRLRIVHRVLFTTFGELISLLRAYGWEIDLDIFSDEYESEDDAFVFRKSSSTQHLKLLISKQLFDEQFNIVVMQQTEWSDSIIKLHTTKRVPEEYDPFAEE